MSRSLTARLLRSGLALLLVLSFAGGLAATSPAATSAQGETGIPGFEPLPAEAELIAFASGSFPGSGVATLIVERIALEANATLDPVAGPFVLLIEQGRLVYEDDLGLEAEIATGSSQFFAPGEGTTLSNPDESATIIVRTALITDAPINGGPAPEDGGDPDSAPDDADDSDDRGPGEDSPIRPRGDDADRGSAVPQGGAARGLILQETAAPDEVVISLTESGFAPDLVSIAAGGLLVIENAGETSCTFAISDLDIEISLESGDIEQVVIDGPAGDYTWACTAVGINRLGDGTLTIVGSASSEEPEPEATAEPDGTPAVDDETAQDPGTVTTGLLLQTAVALDGDHELFAATILLQPGGTLVLPEADGSLGLMVSAGDLTVTRPGRAPATLRDGRSVTLPDGTSAEMTNRGDTPITLTLAGVTGSTPATADDVAVSPASESDDDASDPTASGSTEGAAGRYAFFPSDDEMSALGLTPIWNAFTEISDPASNNFWYSDRDAAAAAFTNWNWVGSSEIRYDSGGEATSFGQVNVLGILVDAFEEESGADEFFAYLGTDPTGEETDFLDGVEAVNGAIEFNLGSGDVETMIVVIQAGPHIITLFASGPELDVQALLREVAGMIFSVVG